MLISTRIRKEQRPVQGEVISDWQITAILSDTLIQETDCNSGRKRTLRKSRCSCGIDMLIELNSPRTCRTDGKRVFLATETNTEWGLFRCPGCTKPVSESVPGAEYGPRIKD